MKLLFLILVALNLLALAHVTGWLGDSEPRGEPERISNQLNPQLIVLESTSSTPATEPEIDRSISAARQSETVSEQADSAQTAMATGQDSPTVISEPSPVRQQTPVIHNTAPERSAEPNAAATRPAEPSPPPPVVVAAPMACVAYDAVREPIAEQIERFAADYGANVRVSRTLTEPASGWWVRIAPASSREAANQRAAELRLAGINDLFVVRENGPDQHAISLGLFRTEAAARQHLSDLQRRRVNDASVTRRTPATYRIELRGPADVLPRITSSLPSRTLSASSLACRP